MSTQFQDAFMSWLKRAQKLVAESAILSADPNGVKYIRIIREDYGQRSVHCFVDIETGNVLFPASWKSPTKHSPVRGNIWTPGMEGVGRYGANYIK